LPTKSARNRELAVTAIDENRELDLPRTAEIHQGVQRCADGTSRKQHVVDEYDDRVVEVEWISVRRRTGWSAILDRSSR
jgi:hypothetical protein